MKLMNYGPKIFKFVTPLLSSQKNFFFIKREIQKYFLKLLSILTSIWSSSLLLFSYIHRCSYSVWCNDFFIKSDLSLTISNSSQYLLSFFFSWNDHLLFLICQWLFFLVIYTGGMIPLLMLFLYPNQLFVVPKSFHQGWRPTHELITHSLTHVRTFPITIKWKSKPKRITR